MKGDSEARRLKRIAADLSVADVEKQAAVSFDVEIRVMLFCQLPLDVRQVLKSKAVVMPVSFAVVDAEDTECGEVLMQRDQRHVGKVFTGLKGSSTMLDFELTSQAEVEQ